MLEFKAVSASEFSQLISEIIAEYAHQIITYGIEADQVIANNISQTAG